MRPLFLMFCLLCSVFSANAQSAEQFPTQAAPGESQAGSFLFKIPAGWKRHSKMFMTYLVPETDGKDWSTFIQLRSYPMGGRDLRTAFNDATVKALTRYQVVSQGPVIPEHSARGVDYLYTTAKLTDRDGKSWMFSIFGFSNATQIESLVFMSSDLQQEALQANLKSFQDFMKTVHFAAPYTPPQAVPGQTVAASENAGNTPANAQPVSTRSSIERDMSIPPSGPMSFNQLNTVPGKFNGIFRARIPEGVDNSGSLNIADPSRNTPNFQYLILFSDGSALRGLPTMGLSALKPSVRLDISGGGPTAARWGAYQMAGNNGQVVFASPTAAGQQLVMRRFVGDAWSIQELDDKLVVNGVPYTMMDSGVPGMKLQGTYKPSGDNSQPGITFTPDGEFNDEGIMKGHATAMGVVGGGLAMGYGFSSPGPGRGSYRTGNYTLNLNYTTSQSIPVLFWIDPASPNAQVIYLGNVKYQRVR